MDELKEMLKAVLHNQKVANAKLESLEKRFIAFEERVDNRFESLERKVDSLEETMERRFDGMEVEFRQVKRRMNAIENDLDHTIGRMQKVESKVGLS